MIILGTTCGRPGPDCLWREITGQGNILPAGNRSASSGQEERKPTLSSSQQAGGHPSDHLGKTPETPSFSLEGTTGCRLVTV